MAAASQLKCSTWPAPRRVSCVCCCTAPPYTKTLFQTSSSTTAVCAVKAYIACSFTAQIWLEHAWSVKVGRHILTGVLLFYAQCRKRCRVGNTDCPPAETQIIEFDVNHQQNCVSRMTQPIGTLSLTPHEDYPVHNKRNPEIVSLPRHGMRKQLLSCGRRPQHMQTPNLRASWHQIKGHAVYIMGHSIQYGRKHIDREIERETDRKPNASQSHKQ